MRSPHLRFELLSEEEARRLRATTPKTYDTYGDRVAAEQIIRRAEERRRELAQLQEVRDA